MGYVGAKRDYLNLGAWSFSCVVGALLLSVTALANSSASAIPWYVATVSLTVALVLVTRTGFMRDMSRIMLVAYAHLLPLAVLALSFGAGYTFADERMRLHTANPNLLASDVAVASVAVVALSRRGLSAGLLFGLSSFAIVLTGSRTGTVALLVGWLAALLCRRVSAKGLVSTALVVLVLAGSFTWSIHIGRAQEASPNLLRATTSAADRAWVTSYAAYVRVEERATAGPYPGVRADRVIAVSGGDAALTSERRRLVIVQGGERSEHGQPYVGSVYLRADVPQVVVLSTQLSKTQCTVDAEWSRCVTPAGLGDGSASAQLRLETQHDGDSIDVFVFGPQLERAGSVSPYHEKRALTRLQRSIWRLAGMLDSLGSARDRWDAMKAGWAAFVESPWTGIGAAGVARHYGEWADQRGLEAVNHAHNLVIERLAVDGLVGMLGWLLVFGAPFAAATSRSPGSAVPLLVCLLALNTADVTLFHQGTFIASWLVVGHITAVGREPSCGRKTQAKRLAESSTRSRIERV